MNVTVSRKAHFNAAHKLYNSDWTDARNTLVFGKCSNPNYHGHNYVLETWIEGPVDEETGYVIDLKKLKELVKEEITERFDHRNLNLDCEEFKTLKPSAENIAIVIWQLLTPKLDPKYKLTIRLWETENNVVEYDGQ